MHGHTHGHMHTSVAHRYLHCKSSMMAIAKIATGISLSFLATSILAKCRFLFSLSSQDKLMPASSLQSRLTSIYHFNNDFIVNSSYGSPKLKTVARIYILYKIPRICRDRNSELYNESRIVQNTVQCMSPVGSLYRVHDGVQGTNKLEFGTEENPMNLLMLI